MDKVFNTQKNMGIETIQPSMKYTGTTNKRAVIQSPATKYQLSDKVFNIEQTRTHTCVKQRVKYGIYNGGIETRCEKNKDKTNGK